MRRGFPGKPESGVGIDSGRGSSKCKGLERRDSVSVQGRQVITRDQRPEFEGKVMKDEAAQVSRETCSEGVLGV